MRSLPAAALLLALSACALPQQRSRTFTPYAPLEAYITSTTTGAPLFYVNRPAYVAMFYLVPGQGVSMLYPGFGSGSLTGRVFAGSHFASGRINNGHHYLPTRASYGTPRYYFLIASDRPLNVEQFGAFGDGLMSRLGTTFGSFSAYSTMERIARIALPDIAEEGSWTTDFFVSWPSVIFTEPGPRRVLVSCNGYRMYVPASYVAVVRSMMCQQRPDSADDGAIGEPGEEGGEDKESVVRPKGRAPLPAEADSPPDDGRQQVSAAERRAMLDRIRVSSQLAGPGAREAMEAPRDEYGYVRSRERPTYGSAAGSSAGRDAGSASSSRPASRGAADAAASSRGGSSASAPPARGGSAAAPAPRPSSSGTSSESSGRQGRSRATVD